MKYSLLLLFLCVYSSLYSQEKNSRSIVQFSDKLLIRANLIKQSESFLINDDDESTIIEANNTYKIKLSGNYKFLGLSIGFSPNSGNSNFKSKFRNAQLRLFYNQWFQTIEYRKVQGFYQDDFNIGEPVAQFPHFKTTNWTGSTSYIFNPDFSLKHLLSFNEWQVISEGSFVPSINYGSNRLSDFVEDGKYEQNNFDIAITPSYFYTWVIKERWFISSSIAPALGVRFSKEKISGIETEDTFITKALNLSLQFGYTSNDISAGAKFNFDSNAAKENVERNFVNDKSYASIYFGYRFNPPRFIERTADWIEDKIGL
ncbi:DUF4421 family protein [uncultured Lacinutrix sp.]|uniref:DUF4421 family protein n=1 Tax=uncultured Lacinutrix sp. TaxID=574032 RepID=UPI002636C2FF|nr:DUF4421 family protein [uncultured Lacinutrix sp.]